MISTENSIMAGPVRQPIDVVALENYIGQYDLGISPPLNLKQVTSLPPKLFHTSIPEGTQKLNLLPHLVVWIWPVQSDIPNHRCKIATICASKEATGRDHVQNGAPGGARISHLTCTGEYRSASAQSLYFMRRSDGNRYRVLHHGVLGRPIYHRSLHTGSDS